MYYNMYYIICFLLFTTLVIKYYFVLFLNIISFFIGIFCYLFHYRRNSIFSKNLKLVLGDINFIKKQLIMINSYKNFSFNTLVVFLQFIFGYSYLNSYYNINKYTIKKNTLLVACHYGLYHDQSSLISIFNTSIGAIYKGPKNIQINKKLKIFKHSNIDFDELYKNKLIATAIDQKSSDLPKINFLNQNLKFHNKLVKYCLKKDRDIIFAYVEINLNSLNLQIVKIETKNKDLKDIIQLIADKMTILIINNPKQYLWFHDRFK